MNRLNKRSARATKKPSNLPIVIIGTLVIAAVGLTVYSLKSAPIANPAPSNTSQPSREQKTPTTTQEKIVEALKSAVCKRCGGTGRLSFEDAANYHAEQSVLDQIEADSRPDLIDAKMKKLMHDRAYREFVMLYNRDQEFGAHKEYWAQFLKCPDCSK